MGLKQKTRSLAIKKRAVISDDPDAIISTLQIAKRLIRENADSGGMTVMEALNAAIPMAAPKDPARTYWSTYRLVFRHVGLKKSSLSIISDAAKAQGEFNVAFTKLKGKRR